MDFEETVLLIALLIRRRIKRRKSKRRYWVQPLLCERKESQFYKLYEDLRQNDEEFLKYFQMSKRSFDELLSLLQKDISGVDTNMRKCIPAVERLALTLRYLATGCTFTELHVSYRYGISTIATIIQRVCGAVWQLLKKTSIPLPTEEQWLEIADDFEKNCNFPNCLGAINGKQIRIKSSSSDNSLNSLVLLAICDSNYRFVHVDVGIYGKSSDSTIFENSVIYNELMKNSLNIPKRRKLNGSDTYLPFVILADDTFSSSPVLVRPYKGHLSVKKKVFNYRLTRARRQSECAFGILSNKWRIFQRPLNVSVEFSEEIVKTCCVLHNFVLERDGYEFQDTLTVEGVYDMPALSIQGGRVVNGIRDQFADYFISEGQLPWQLQKI